MSSCTPPPAPVAPAAPAAPTEVGRYQVVVSSEGERGAVLFLLDTKEGATWIYRPPQGPAFNGFWSDIPRLNWPSHIHQQAINAMMQPPPPSTNAPARPPASGTTTPAPGTGTTP